MNLPRLPIPSLHAAANALNAALPPEMQAEVAHEAAQEQEELLSMADQMQKAINAWQRAILVEILGEPTMTAADGGDLKAMLLVQNQGLKIQKVQCKASRHRDARLVYVMHSKLKESKREVEISRLRFVFKTDGSIISETEVGKGAGQGDA